MRPRRPLSCPLNRNQTGHPGQAAQRARLSVLRSCVAQDLPPSSTAPACAKQYESTFGARRFAAAFTAFSSAMWLRRSARSRSRDFRRLRYRRHRRRIAAHGRRLSAAHSTASCTWMAAAREQHLRRAGHEMGTAVGAGALLVGRRSGAGVCRGVSVHSRPSPVPESRLAGAPSRQTSGVLLRARPAVSRRRAARARESVTRASAARPHAAHSLRLPASEDWTRRLASHSDRLCFEARTVVHMAGWRYRLVNAGAARDSVTLNAVARTTRRLAYLLNVPAAGGRAP